MAREIAVGSARSTSPGRTTGRLPVGSLPDGAPIELPVVIVQGDRNGPVLWLHGCVHGNEYCGTFVIHEFLRGLDPVGLAGTVVALPVVNLAAFRSGRRTSPFEIFNGGDMNRAFPGDPAGVATEQMAAVLFGELKQHADALVDFHTAVTPDVRWALFPKRPGRVGEVSESMARAFGYRDTLPAPDTILAGSAMAEAARAGIPSLIVEAGGRGPSFTPATVTDAAARLRNVARSLAMLEGPVDPPEPMTFFSNFRWVTAKQGGLFRKSVACGDPIEPGSVLGQYYDVFGHALSEVRAPVGGVVLAIASGPIIGQGETLVHIGLEPRPA